MITLSKIYSTGLDTLGATNVPSAVFGAEPSKEALTGIFIFTLIGSIAVSAGIGALIGGPKHRRLGAVLGGVLGVPLVYPLIGGVTIGMYTKSLKEDSNKLPLQRQIPKGGLIY